MKKGILFDVDGTLWDSAPQVTEAWNDILSSCPDAGRTITVEDMYQYMGRPMDEISRMMLPHLEEKRRWEIMERCMEYENEYLLTHPGVLYPGVREALCRLAGEYELYVVSNCQDGYIQTFLEVSGLGDCFAGFTCSGMTGHGKGENLKIIVQKHGIERPLYIGDTQGDCNACQFAGVPFIHAAYGMGQVDREVPHIERFADLPELIPTILKD